MRPTTLFLTLSTLALAGLSHQANYTAKLDAIAEDPATAPDDGITPYMMRDCVYNCIFGDCQPVCGQDWFCYRSCIAKSCKPACNKSLESAREAVAKVIQILKDYGQMRRILDMDGAKRDKEQKAAVEKIKGAFDTFKEIGKFGGQKEGTDVVKAGGGDA
ncbi:hypothetical protein B0T17DRAFT_642090 [Bombardia bombarda]|uniref:Extracellular membrane protein CFEM domain-containing protein n=1 Tax=Bombardia bombarda TaxID=252184 RepID=A0AA39WUJ4_9PEZI|nr:hypothetical protein B0T17DRAFT_642090 [Bombardia bombarda]